VFTVPRTPSTYQQADSTYYVKFGPLYTFYIEELLVLLRQARDQYRKTNSRLIQLLYSQKMGQ